MTQYTCTVDQAGAAAPAFKPTARTGAEPGEPGKPTKPKPVPETDPGGLYIILTDVGGAFKKRFFYFHQSWPREMLAVALTAISTQRKVDADVDDPPDGEDLAWSLLCHRLGIIVD